MLPPGLWVAVVAAAWSTAARWIMGTFSFRDGVVAARAAGPAPAQATGGQGQAVPGSVVFDRFHGVLRAGGGEPAGGDPPGPDQLVETDQGEGHSGRAGDGPGPLPTLSDRLWGTYNTVH